MALLAIYSPNVQFNFLYPYTQLINNQHPYTHIDTSKLPHGLAFSQSHILVSALPTSAFTIRKIGLMRVIYPPYLAALDLVCFRVCTIQKTLTVRYAGDSIRTHSHHTKTLLSTATIYNSHKSGILTHALPNILTPM